MSKPKKLIYSGDIKVVKRIVERLNWLIDTIYEVIPASSVTYDNTTSGLSATNVQAGIDELSGEKADASSVYTKTETDTLLSGKLDNSLKGAYNGLAELDSSGKVPSSQLPSYVDDVIEGYYNSNTDRFYKESTFITVIPPEDGKSWVDVTTNKSYRWTGSVYTRVDEGVQLGETSSTAYRGDRGKTAYDHSQLTSGNPHNVSKSDVGLGNVPNVSTNDQTPTFSQASTRANIVSGEKLSVILGKIMKFFADLKTVAFTANYSDLNGTPTIPTNAYQSTDTAETTLADDDKIPFYDTSASGRRNSTWANIKAKLKSYFDGIYSTTDEKVTSVETNPSSNTSYNIPFVSGTSNQQPKINDGINYTTREGTTTSEGISMLLLGNSISSGTAKSKYGILRIFSKSDKYASINTDNLSANRTHKLPDKDGTIALLSDIPTTLNPTDNELANNADLNDITTVGFYRRGGGNSITNKPSGVDSFGLIVVHSAAGAYYEQVLFDTSNRETYIRYKETTSTWGAWQKIALQSGNVASADNVPWNGLTGMRGIHYDNSSDFNSYAWHKVATTGISASSQDRIASWYVTGNYGANGVCSGILMAKLRSDSNASLGTMELYWQYKVDSSVFSLNDFCLTYDSTTKIVTLWCKIPQRYGGYKFTLLENGNRTTIGENSWTMLNSSSGHGESIYSGDTVVWSKLRSLDVISGSITSGNTQAVTGGAVYDYLNTTSYNFVYNGYADKSGNVVTLSLCEVDYSDLTGTSGIIPSGYRPKRRTYATVSLYDGSQPTSSEEFRVGYMTIETNGNVSIIWDDSNSYYPDDVRGVITYIV